MQLKNEELTMIVDETTMEISSLKLGDVEFIYQQTNQWKKSFPTLFPICGTLINDQYTHDNKTYTLKRHGFFRDLKNWTLEDKSEQMAKFKFRSQGEFLNVYPWEFELTYQFNLAPTGLQIQTTVKNLSAQPMPYSLGYHPAFLVQKEGVISFDQPQELFTDTKELKYLVRDPQTGIVIDQTKVGDLDFTNSQFYWTTKNVAKKFTYRDKEKWLTIDLTTYQDKTFIVWSESNDADFVCFEPMSGHADYADRKNFSFAEKDQIVLLANQEEKTHYFTLEVGK